MIRITEITDKILDYYPDADLDLINRSYIYSAKVHDGQLRLDGEPYLSHPLEVANILADMKLDTVSIASGLLHDVVEDTHATLDDIKAMFGIDVLKIVDGVTKISSLSFDTASIKQAENIRKMILAMAQDIRVILIKLADRLHNIRTLQFHRSEAKRKSIAQETLDIYAPIAARLGIFWIKKELEEISFAHAFPEGYEKTKRQIAASQSEGEKYVEEVKGLLQNIMNEAHLTCQIQGRYKQLYSIYQKMMKQQLEFKQVYDIIAFRIILDTIPQCYETLGLLHAKFKPIPFKFKDYIGFPKPNGYQSLHTTVMGPYNERMEIQIRTHEMDKVAKSGIAAHWSYKEGKTMDKTTQQTFEWLQNLVEQNEAFGDAEEFLDNVKIDLYPKDVYIFTPRGEVKNMPKGSTPVDFAYMIHSQVGNQCTGARINGRMVPLQYQLQSGDMVEVLTTKGHTPSPDWLNYVVTSKARGRIRQWIKKQEEEKSIALGRELCEKAFRKNKLNFNDLLGSPEMARAASELNFKTVDDLIANVGYGKITPLQVIRKLVPDVKPEKDKTLLEKLISRGKEKKKKEKDAIVVDGLDNILIRLGKCCQPVPGDQITGYITLGAGITVHRKGCVNALKLNPDRQIDVRWKQDLAGMFPVKMRIRCYDRIGLLADITSVISKAEANIIDLNLESQQPDKMVLGSFTIGVKDLGHLDNVIAKIKKIDAVQEIARI